MAERQETSNEDRTESATAYRREEFRKQGLVAISREALSIALLSGVGGSLYLVFAASLKEFHHLAEEFFTFQGLTEMSRGDVFLKLRSAANAWFWILAPAFTAVIVSGVSACTSQIGFYVTWEPLTPKWERLSPVEGFRRMFAGQGLAEAAKALGKIIIATTVTYYFFRNNAEGLGNLLSLDVASEVSVSGSLLAKLFFTLVGSLSVVAIGDYAFQRFRLEKQMRMTRREVKEEFKLREGDPLIKSRIRGLQRRMMSKRMMEEVPKADVVVTNPTHFAVALKYDSEMHAPKVVAKGMDHMAAKIRELARNAGVPLVENKPLARTLYRDVEVGHFIPRELYSAVAEVIGYVFRLRGMTSVA